MSGSITSTRPCCGNAVSVLDGRGHQRQIGRRTDRLFYLRATHVGSLNAAMRDGERPRHQMGRHLGGRTIGLHGCGKRRKRRLSGFFADGIARSSSRYPGFSEFFMLDLASHQCRSTNLSASEVLSLHIPLNDRTRGLYSADVLENMRDDAVLMSLVGAVSSMRML